MAAVSEPLVPTRLETAAVFRRWVGIFSAYFSSQSVVQLLGIGAGLLYVNFLSVREFALYTLASSVTNFFTFLSDMGSTTSLFHFFRDAGRTGEAFGDYLLAVLSLRRIVFAAGAVAIVAIFPYLAAAKGFGAADALPLLAGILTAVWFQINSSLRLTTLRLHGRYNPSYRAEMLGAGLRLLLAAAMVASAILHAWIALLATAAGSILVSWLADSELAHPVAVSPELGVYRRRILRYLLPTLPGALFFSVQGPLVVWLSATFGEARNIAEVGALGRLGLIVGIFSGLIGTVFLPRLASLKDEARYRRRCIQYGLFLAAAAGTLLAASWLFPKLFLILVGPNYRGLHRELVLLVAGSGLSLLGGYVVNVNFARGWIRFQTVTTVLEFGTQIVLVKLLPLATTAGVLIFTLLSTATGLALQLVVLELGFRRPAWVSWRHQ